MGEAGIAPDRFRTTLPLALLDARAKHGGGKEILEDPERTPLTYDKLLLGALVLGRKLKGEAGGKSNVGVLLPNVNGVAVTLFGLWFEGLTPVLLNFTAGPRNITLACETAQLSVIVTSRRFVDQARLDDVVAAIGQGRKIVYLEDVRKALTGLDKAVGIWRSLFARAAARRAGENPDAPAVILFTSGSEGAPKGVVLSHANIAANAAQIWKLADGMLTADDVAMNPLPVFHSFGLTAGMMLGLLNGMKVVLYPSPLHFKQVPKLIGETRATFLFATDTFLVGYARAADDSDLNCLKNVVTGAEKVKDSTRVLWAKWPAEILEGYGCTECSPVLACNTPADNRHGSVGRLMELIDFRLDPVEGITEGAKLVVRGPNVMLGYMLHSEPGKVHPPGDGWHDTGDIVEITDDGFVTIKGRAKRFAKIGGEMVSLAGVETIASSIWPGATHVAVALPDPKKGEQIVLITDKPDADRAAFIAAAKEHGAAELQFPRAILVVGSIPVLGSGKIDYPAATEVVKRMRALI
jgi:acyl-[acyl-carrier-protein]-phospholipid O-acyltransferase/long-chain-fatty-acid--[acyl-carrier-protein] ligase